MTWSEPMAGRLAETYHVRGDKLYVRSEVEIGDQSEGTTVVGHCIQHADKLVLRPCLDAFVTQSAAGCRCTFGGIPGGPSSSFLEADT